MKTLVDIPFLWEQYLICPLVFVPLIGLPSPVLDATTGIKQCPATPTIFNMYGKGSLRTSDVSGPYKLHMDSLSIAGVWPHLQQ